MKICPSPYKLWLQNQNECNKTTENDMITKNHLSNETNIDHFFTHISKYNSISSNSNIIFVAIKLPTNVFIYEWFQEDILFKVLKDFVIAMDVSHEFSDELNKNFVFVDLLYEKLEFSDDQPINIVFQKEKEAIENKKITNANICSSDKIFLKIKMVQSH